MKKLTLLIILIALGFSGCSSKKPRMKHRMAHQPVQRTYEPSTPAKQLIFQKTMMEVAKSTLTDARYQKMALDTPEKKRWFKSLMYSLWDRQMTRNEFIAEGLKKYPNKRYEFTFVADGFQKRS